MQPRLIPNSSGTSQTAQKTLKRKSQKQCKFNKMLLISNFKKPSTWQPHTDYLFSKIMSVMAASQCLTAQSSRTPRHSANKPAALAPSLTQGHQRTGKDGITQKENNLGTRAVAQVMIQHQAEKPVVAKQQQQRPQRDSLLASQQLQ